jgi:hypothetical protein
MSTIQKVSLGIVGVGAITALTLPGRTAAQVATAIGNSFLTSPLNTAIKG